MDIISHFLDAGFNWAGQLPTVYVQGIVRTLLLFGLPAVFVATMFARGNRSIFFQVIGCVVGLLLAATIPVDILDVRNRYIRGWVIVLSLAILAFLPAMLAFLLVPPAGPQRKVRVFLYVMLGVLLSATLIQSGGGS